MNPISRMPCKYNSGVDCHHWEDGSCASCGFSPDGKIKRLRKIYGRCPATQSNDAWDEISDKQFRKFVDAGYSDAAIARFYGVSPKMVTRKRHIMLPEHTNCHAKGKNSLYSVNYREIKAMIRADATATEIANRFGVTEGTARNWKRKVEGALND